MPSLDGYSLNEKMDKKFKDIDEKIEAVHFRIETELQELRGRFSGLYEKQDVKKNKFVKKHEPKVEVKEEPKVEPQEEPKKKGWFGR